MSSSGGVTTSFQRPIRVRALALMDFFARALLKAEVKTGGPAFVIEQVVQSMSTVRKSALWHVRILAVDSVRALSSF